MTQTDTGELFNVSQNRVSEIQKILGISETDKISIKQILKERFGYLKNNKNVSTCRHFHSGLFSSLVCTFTPRSVSISLIVSVIVAMYMGVICLKTFNLNSSLS